MATFKARGSIKMNKTKRVRRRTVAKAKPTKAFAKKVQTIINKNLEDKQAYLQAVDQSFNSGIQNLGDALQILPNISQGTDDNNRIGDQIRAKRMVVQGHFISALTLQNYNNARMAVRIMIVQPKALRDLASIQGTTSWMLSLLKKGGTTTAFTGAVQDIYAPINTDLVTKYYDKVFFIKCPYAPAGPSGDLNETLNTRFFKCVFKFKNKLLRYDDSVGSNITPTSFNPVIVLGYAMLNNATPDTVTTAINMSFISTLDFQDA